MRDSKRDTDVKNRLLDSVGEGEGGMDSVTLLLLIRVRTRINLMIHGLGFG